MGSIAGVKRHLELTLASFAGRLQSIYLAPRLGFSGRGIPVQRIRWHRAFIQPIMIGGVRVGVFPRKRDSRGRPSDWKRPMGPCYFSIPIRELAGGSTQTGAFGLHAHSLHVRGMQGEEPSLAAIRTSICFVS